MATPHVAGVAALYLQSNPTASPSAVATAVTSSATQGVVGNAAGSPNRLLYSLLTTPEPPVTVQEPPVANDDSAEVTPGGTVTVPVLDNDTDANGNSLTVTNLTQPSNGGSTSTNGTTVTFIAPAAEDTYTFTYTANDGIADSNVATVTVTVAAAPPPPPPPAGASDAYVSYNTAGGRFNDKHLIITVTLRDEAGNAVTGTAVGITVTLNGSLYGTGSGTTSSNGSVSWEIKNARSGTYATTVDTVAGAAWDPNATDDPGFPKQ